MMQNSLYIGHLGPIPIYIHWSAIFLVAMSWYWVGGPGASSFDAVFFLIFLFVLIASILLHEMGHGLAARAVARNEGERAVTITLQAFGGVCMSRGDHAPWKRLFVVLAGPAVSLALWLGCGTLIILCSDAGWGSWWTACISPGTVISVFGPDWPLWTLQAVAICTTMNLGLLIFNMIPIYPFDGGQALYNGLKLMIKDWDLVRKMTMTLSVALALGYFAYRLQQGADPGSLMYLALIYGIMLYSAYVSLFIYRQ